MTLDVYGDLFEDELEAGGLRLMLRGKKTRPHVEERVGDSSVTHIEAKREPHPVRS